MSGHEYEVLEEGIDNERFQNRQKPRMEEVRLCEEWIGHWIDRRKTINWDYSSYGLKHCVERANDRYVTNGAFIQAALNLGYKVKPESINAYFNMSFVRARKQPKESGFCVLGA